MNAALVIMGTWLVTDCIYSISLYLNAPSYEGSIKQTWRRDHYIRVIRGLIGISIIVTGAVG